MMESFWVLPPGELKTPRRRNNRPPDVVNPVIAVSPRVHP